MKCKPGDLAIIIQDESPFLDLGKIVKVKTAEYDFTNEEWCWLCDSESGSPIQYFDEEDRRQFDTRDLLIPDAWLLPIRPGDISEDEERELIAPKTPEVVS